MLNNMTKKQQYYIDNKEYIDTKSKKYRELNTEKMNATGRAWYQANKERIRAQRAEYSKRYRQDPMKKLAHNMRIRLKIALKQNKSQATMKMVGCSLEVLKNHLESQFKLGMTWENYGQWHVDHMTPLSSAKTVEDMVKLCHFSNLQPLWALENKTKKDKRVN